MPMYEYRCNKCGEIFEELVSSDDEKVPCPKCGSTETEKLLSACASHTKGGAVSTTSVTSANGSSAPVRTSENMPMRKPMPMMARSLSSHSQSVALAARLSG